MVIMNHIMLEFNFFSLILRESGKNITHLFCLGELAFIIHFFKDVGTNGEVGVHALIGKQARV